MTSNHCILLLCLSFVVGSCATTMEDTNHPPVGVEPAPLTNLQTMQPDSINVPLTPVANPPNIAQSCTLFDENGAILRTELNQRIEGGLGRWLQHVEGDRSIAKGRFQGWQIKSLHPQDPCYLKIPLRPADVVTSVNGKGLEKPEQAFEVIERLKTANALVVDYLRDGQPHTMRLEISPAFKN